MNVEELRTATAPLLALLLAGGLLAGALAWHVPMMLWDHLDLVPMVRAWQQGTLSGSGFWHLHGGHMHTAAYALLLVTTWLSDGRAWLDSMVSWCLLLAWFALVWRMARATLPVEAGLRRWWCVLVLLALHPGHLANLQWGWQVAVFLCLAGVAAAIALLAGARLDWPRNLAALAAALLAYLSFATGMAVLPVALVLIALRTERTRVQRLVLAAPWLLFALLVVGRHAAAAAGEGRIGLDHAVYVLNYLGSGIARFATDLAPWLAAVALLSGVLVPGRELGRPRYRPWLALLLLGLAAALLTAMGRAGSLGSGHAFVTRYVSFSLVFWLGWSGIMAVAWARGRWRRGGGAVVAVVLVLGGFNGLHMVAQAVDVAVASRATARQIACSWPEVDRALLARIYFGDADEAWARLRMLRELGFAPFAGAAVDCDARARTVRGGNGVVTRGASAR